MKPQDNLCPKTFSLLTGRTEKVIKNQETANIGLIESRSGITLLIKMLLCRCVPPCLYPNHKISENPPYKLCSTAEKQLAHLYYYPNTATKDPVQYLLLFIPGINVYNYVQISGILYNSVELLDIRQKRVFFEVFCREPPNFQIDSMMNASIKISAELKNMMPKGKYLKEEVICKISTVNRNSTRLVFSENQSHIRAQASD
jgi:hypothetical protein